MFKQTEKYLDLMQELKEAYTPFETIIQKLKNAGASQITTIKLLIDLFGLSIRQADELVLNSQAWADSYEATVSFREELWDAMIQEGDEVEIDGDKISVTFDLTKDEDESQDT